MDEAQAALRNRLAVGNGWLSWSDRVLQVYATDCRRIAEFVPWLRLPAEDVRLESPPDFCASGMDCRHLQFVDGGDTRYEDIRVLPGATTHAWRIEATLRSPALRDGQPRRISSEDGGLSWRIERIAGPPT